MMAKPREYTAERCMGEYVKYRSPTHPQCTSDAVLYLEWTVNESGLPGLGVTWKSWACALHTAQVIRWALAREGLIGPVRVKAVPA